LTDIGSHKRDAAALLLASGNTVRSTAAEVGVGERTLHRWRADPAFRRREVELRGELLASGFGRLCATAAEAADVLKGLLASEAEGIRLAAARSVLTVASELRKTVELQATVDELNTRLKAIETIAANEDEE
jgi:transposase-like protein